MRILAGERKQLAKTEEGAHFCSVVAGVVGAVAGAAISSSGSRKAASTAAGAQNYATEAEERVGMAQLEQSKEEFAYNKERAARMDALTEKVTNSQLATQDQQNALAKDYDNYNKTTFRPLEQQIVNDANAYDTPGRQEAEAAKSAAEVQRNFTQQQQASNRNMARMGVNPNSGRFAGTQATMGANQALAEAGAENAARTKVETVGAARKMDAASLGRGLPSAQATAAGLGITAGNSAVSNQATANNSYVAGQQPGISLLNSAGNTFGSAAANFGAIYGAANKATADTMSGIGSAAGMYMRYGTGASSGMDPYEFSSTYGTP